MNKIYYIMGVSGCGKSTVGKLLAERLSIPFYDGDDFHPIANIEKMKTGLPLNDIDREPWLKNLWTLAKEALEKKGAVIATSALKKKYRAILEKDIEQQRHWIFLDGSFETISKRMKERKNHFMPPGLLKSQFDTLEKPENAITISILVPPNQVIDNILKFTKMELSQFGVIGLGVMGRSLSLNLAEKGFKLSLFNRHEAGVEENVANDFIASDPLLNQSKGFDQLSSFVASLEQPRRILMMIKAGPALDKVIEIMIPELDAGDILIDGGNSHYSDTARRMSYLKKQNIHFIGSGISGGEEGARKGPSIMPGGAPEAYAPIKEFLEAIAAKDKSGKACCAFIGKEGAGHFVKMVHNGVEYAEMQLIAEAYGLLRFGNGLSPDEIAIIFQSWMSQGLSSYLLEISISILKTKEGDEWLIDKILDKAGNKGTGSWTTIAAAELGVPVTMISAALFARYTSSFKKERVANSKAFSFEQNGLASPVDTEDLQKAYQLARIINHHQGFELMEAASQSFGWELNHSETARIWTNGCIIRSDLMEQLVDSLQSDHRVLNIKQMKSLVEENNKSLSKVAIASIQNNQSSPCLNAASNYLIAYTAEQSTANIIQAQRDFFGAHLYQRTDDPEGKMFHTKWIE